MCKYIFIFIIIGITISSCRFSKPLLSNKTYDFTYRDTLTNNIIKKANYRYTNLLSPSIKGGYVVLRRYEINNNSMKLIKKTCTKTSSLDLFELNEMIYEKTYYFENEKIREVDFKVYQTNGNYKNICSQKIITYKDGKKHIQIN